MNKKCLIVILVIILLIILSKVYIFNKDERGLYLINKDRSIYSDIKDPKMVLDGKVTSVKDIALTNCTASCIHHYSIPISVLFDGGSKIYSYNVDNETYYLIECNKLDSKYHNGKDIIISKSLDSLPNYC